MRHATPGWLRLPAPGLLASGCILRSTELLGSPFRGPGIDRGQNAEGTPWDTRCDMTEPSQ
jgi:hypothetical protein